MNRNCFSRWPTVLMITVLWALSPAFVKAAEQKVVEASFKPGQISFKPLVANRGLTLTVSGPDHFRFVRNFEQGETPTFVAAQEGGSPLPDGSYTYEIKVTPVLDEETRRLLVMARQQGDKSAIEELRSRGERSVEPLVQSGWITVHNGAFITPSESEVANKDIVHADDVIIDGSQCVGNDCYSGLAFGFDTIVLMENNLRIFFDDTSTIQNYPRNDWRIIANDSTDGGGRYFAIEDATEVEKIFVLEAGAPANSLYVDSHGDVGINTSTPYYELHIVDGDTPTVRLDQDGSYGWTPQKWDLSGNESNFFIRDATHASKLPFRIEPDSPTDSIFIKSNGNVGIGTGSPGAPLHVVENLGGALDNIMVVENTTTGSGSARLVLRKTNITPSATNDPTWIFNSNGTLRLSAGTDSAEFELDASGNLRVTGSYRVNGTTLNVPDYVFEPDYHLMPMNELKSFLSENRRLPNLPSAEEISANGLNMTETQLRLLEKIEELTLYTLAQEDRLNKLDEENAELKARLAELEKTYAGQPR